MRYLVTTELKTPFLLKVRRFFRLAKPRVEFLFEWGSWWDPFIGDKIEYLGILDKRVKFIKKTKQRLVWKQ